MLSRVPSFFLFHELLVISPPPPLLKIMETPSQKFNLLASGRKGRKEVGVIAAENKRSEEGGKKKLGRLRQ